MQTRNFLLTGPPGSGKTTLLMRLVRRFVDRSPAGFYTAEIREGGVRQGFRLVGVNGSQGVLAHVRFRGGPRVGRYGVDVPGFEAFLDQLDLAGSRAGLVFIDEIGKMECLSARFVALMRELLDSERVVVATVAARGGGFITEVKQRPDCTLAVLHPPEREELFVELSGCIEDRDR